MSQTTTTENPETMDHHDFDWSGLSEMMSRQLYKREPRICRSPTAPEYEQILAEFPDYVSLNEILRMARENQAAPAVIYDAAQLKMMMVSDQNIGACRYFSARSHSWKMSNYPLGEDLITLSLAWHLLSAFGPDAYNHIRDELLPDWQDMDPSLVEFGLIRKDAFVSFQSYLADMTRQENSGSYDGMLVLHNDDELEDDYAAGIDSYITQLNFGREQLTVSGR